jgi:hypothetical protein
MTEKPRKPLTKAAAYSGHTMAVTYEGEEIAITATTKEHLELVFKRLFPKGNFSTDLVCRAMVVPEKLD